MKVFHSLVKTKQKPTWITIGAYDGLHLGHQALIKDLVAEAHTLGHNVCLVSLYPHPALVMERVKPPFYLTSPQDRNIVLESLGVDQVLYYPFSKEVVNLSPQAFIESLADIMDIRQIWVGEDFALGKDRKGSLKVLDQMGPVMHYNLHIYPQLRIKNQIVSTTRIRQFILQADMEAAATWLGRPYALSGQIIPVNPPNTANHHPYLFKHWEEQILPPEGKYPVILKSDNQSVSCQAIIKDTSFGRRIFPDSGSRNGFPSDTITRLDFSPSQ